MYVDQYLFWSLSLVTKFRLCKNLQAKYFTGKNNLIYGTPIIKFTKKSTSKHTHTHTPTHVSDGDEGSNGRCSILVLLPGHVLRQTARDDDDIISNLGHLLDGEVDESTEGQVLRLKQLGHRKECLCSLRRTERSSLQKL